MVRGWRIERCTINSVPDQGNIKLTGVIVKLNNQIEVTP
jgi:hypothetical protein